MSTRPRRAGGKTALVLAGGGVTGAVYEIGALRAIDDLLTDRSVNDFDIYVGTSAGSLVCSLLANGISPEQMLYVFEGAHPEIRSMESGDVLSLNLNQLMRWGLTIPRRAAYITREYLRKVRELTFFDLLWSLMMVVPPGLYDGQTLQDYVHEVIASANGSDNFCELRRELYVVATDLNTGERVVFSQEENSGVPVSRSVAASTALPPVYQPVAIGDRVLVDGGLRGNASLDLAVEHGADLIVCINPLVPYNEDTGEDGARRPFFRPQGGYLAKTGLQGLLSQITRISTHAGLHYSVKQIRRAHPDVDIIVIEPSVDDCQMFYYNIMHYSVLLPLARHGFESVTLRLAEDYSRYHEILLRHGIPITRRIVIEELSEIHSSGYNPEVIRSVLEKRSSVCSGLKNNPALCQLSRVLAKLELELDQMA